MRKSGYKNGFTLVELLIALMVTGIILTAAATLAFALGKANDSTNDVSQKQAQVRCATIRISELIKHCKLICGTPNSDLAVWRADDNNDSKINVNELVYIQAGTSRNYLRLCIFPAGDTSIKTISEIAALSPAGYSVTYVTLIPQCSNVQFLPDGTPPQTKSVSMSFDLEENGSWHKYQINATLQSWAGYLLNSSGAVVSDDD